MQRCFVYNLPEYQLTSNLTCGFHKPFFFLWLYFVFHIDETKILQLHEIKNSKRIVWNGAKKTVAKAMCAPIWHYKPINCGKYLLYQNLHNLSFLCFSLYVHLYVKHFAISIPDLCKCNYLSCLSSCSFIS